MLGWAREAVRRKRAVDLLRRSSRSVDSQVDADHVVKAVAAPTARVVGRKC